MSKETKQKVLWAFLLITVITVVAGIAYYYTLKGKTSENIRGGVLVYERHVVYSDRQKS